MKKFIKIFLLILVVIICIILVDTFQAKILNNRPIFKISQDFKTYKKDNGVLVYTYILEDNTKNTVFRWEKYDLPESKVSAESEIEKNKIDLEENENKQISGIIMKIENNIFTVKNEDDNKLYTIEINDNDKVINGRTNENIIIADVKDGDYIRGSASEYFEVIRNISGEELKSERLKNLAYCFEEGYLCCLPSEIKDIQNKGDYVIMSFEMEDSSAEHFNQEEKRETFELKAIANSDLKIPSRSGGLTVYNLKEKKEQIGLMIWIKLDKNTINNKIPTIEEIEVYDG